MNEEEVKNTVIVPWLTAQGVPLGELRFEQSFRVKLGRHKLLAGAQHASQATAARLDILVTRQNRNLLIVEVKAEGLALTDDDRDQGISYARLVHPVAPFVLVTNGRDSRLYETLSQSLVEDSTIVAGEYTVALPDQDRIEALKLFLASSPDNVLRLSKAQIETETASLKGGPTDLGAVYISEAHRRNFELSETVHRFLQSSSPLFVVAGEAGSGKSCAAVDIATSLVADGYPTFFYQGGMLESNVLDAVWSELAWTFKEQSDRILALSHLSDQSRDKPFVIVLDALDEWTSAERAKHLRWLAQHIDFAKTRIIATCKEAVWPEFLAVRGQLTGIGPYVFQQNSDKNASFSFGALTHREFHELLRLYRSAFGVSGRIDLAAQDACRRSPFLLRVMFQVAAATGEHDITLYSSNVFRRYLELSVSRTQSADISTNVLRTIAGLMFERDSDWLDEDQVRTALSLRPTESLPSDLFATRLLNCTGPMGARRVTFTFAQLRSYMIAFYARRWHQMAAAEFEVDTKDTEGIVRAESVAMYYADAPEPHRNVINGAVRKTATAYLHRYIEIIDQHFPALREAFLPNTTGEIGFAGILHVARRRLSLFGFRPRSVDEPEVVIVPSETTDDTGFMLQLGMLRAHGGWPVDVSADGDVHENVLLMEIAPQIQRMMSDMMLHEAPVLAAEAVTSALRQHADKFRRLMRDVGRKEPDFPVAISAIRDEYRRDELRAGFRADIEEEKRARGEIKEKWDGQFVSYSPYLTPLESQDLERRVEEAMSSASRPISNVTLVDSVAMWRRVSRSLKELELHGLTHVEQPLSWTERFNQEEDEGPIWSDDFRRYCQEILTSAIQSYAAMVGINFPTLSRHFLRHHLLPCTLILALPRTQQQWGRLYFCRNAIRTEVLVFKAGEVIELRTETGENWTDIETPLGRHAWFTNHSVTIANLIDGPLTTRRSGKQMPGGVVRRWVYSWLNDEIDDALVAFLASAGISSAAAANAGLRLYPHRDRQVQYWVEMPRTALEYTSDLTKTARFSSRYSPRF